MGKTTDCLAPADNESAHERKKRTDVRGILMYPRQTCFQEDQAKDLRKAKREKKFQKVPTTKIMRQLD